MKRTTLKSATAILCSSILFSASVKAQQTESINVVTTAVPFLRISPDARAGGMGDVGIATPADANSSFWNLAKTPFAKNQSAIAVTYTPWLRDIAKDVYLASLGSYYKLDEEQAVSLGVRFFSMGNIQLTDYAGNLQGESRPREFSLDLGYSRKLGNKLGLGVALRYINSNLAGRFSADGTQYKAGTAFAGDISLFHTNVNDQGEGFNWGIALTNLGSKIGYTNDANSKDYIPANLGIGTAYTKVFDENNKLTIGLDINKLLVPTPPLPSENPDPTIAEQENAANLASYRNYSVFESWFKSFGDAGGMGNELKEVQFSLGAEYAYNDQFFFRAGYFYEDKTKGNRKYFTLGAGLTYNVFGLNFSYLVPSGQGITRNPLSNTLRFSLIFNLDEVGNVTQ